MRYEDFRREYVAGGLSRDMLKDCPIAQFEHWLHQAIGIPIRPRTAALVEFGARSEGHIAVAGGVDHDGLGGVGAGAVGVAVDRSADCQHDLVNCEGTGPGDGDATALAAGQGQSSGAGIGVDGSGVRRSHRDRAVAGGRAVRHPERRGAEHLEQLLNLAPNVNLSTGASRGRFVLIRGIGERSQFQEPLNPSIGFIIDGIDFSGLGTAGTLFDVAQVEVLRGPQGALYGRNAVGGHDEQLVAEIVDVPHLAAV